MAAVSHFAVAPRVALCPAAGRSVRCTLAPVRAAKRSEMVDMSGEWEAVTSLSSQDDMLAYLNRTHQPKNTRLHDVMQTNLVLATPDATLEEVVRLLDGPPSIEGLPVVDGSGQLVGVISRKDLSKPGSTVQDVMSTPPVSLLASASVSDAVEVMMQRKFRRVPITDEAGACVGIVTRTDVFWALSQADLEGESYLAEYGLF